MSTFIIATEDLIQNKLELHVKKNAIIIHNRIQKDLKIRTDKNILFLIIHSLIENEIKHNKNTTIYIDYNKKNKKNKNLVIYLSNSNNRGKFDVTTANKFFNSEINSLDTIVLIKGLGFFIIKDLIAKLNGKISFNKLSSNSHITIIDIPNNSDIKTKITNAEHSN